MSLSLFHLAIILGTVFLTACAQLLLKLGANSLTANNSGEVYGNSLLSAISVLFNPYVAAGMVIYVSSAAIWLWVLSKVDISLAYPFVSLSFVITLIFGVTVFNEPVNSSKLIGTLLIVVGCALVARS